MSFVECLYCGEMMELSMGKVQTRQERFVGRKDDTSELKNAVAEITERIGEIESAMDGFFAKLEKIDGFLRRFSQQQQVPPQPQRPMPGGPLPMPPQPPSQPTR